jgi:ubiquinone/menaquinone biosynthesis C-methylase UbiE
MSNRPVWLDLGCGRRPFPEWMSDQAEGVVRSAGWAVGIDLDAGSLRDHQSYPDKVLGGADTLPFKDATFDLVSANMVVEHLPDPAHTLAEIHRVLKPGGRFAFHTPSRFHWPLWLSAHVSERIRLPIVRFLENRRSEDVFPTHYRMNDEAQIRAVAETTGFQIEQLRFLSTSAVTVMLGPVVLGELLWIRLIRRPRLAQLRSNIIAILKKPQQ